MSHCIEIVCITCGAFYCALGCSGGYYPKETVKAAFDAMSAQEAHHYNSLKCKSCGSKTIYDATPIEKKMFTLEIATK